MENYQKQSLRNRCEVLSDKGLQVLTVPVLQSGSQGCGGKILTRDVAIDNSMPWGRNHLRALRSYYAGSPYFDHFFPHVEALLELEHRSLVDLNRASAELLAKLLKLPITLSYTEACPPFTADDPRDLLSRKRGKRPEFTHPPYYQVFSETLPHYSNLSGLDLLFCEGRFL